MPERIPELRVLGELALVKDGAAAALPRSRKTRALVAYLAVTAKRQRRERLCEIFWQVPDDPRGALRWSLSKLRPLVGDYLQADRDAVALEGLPVDWRSLKAELATPTEETSLERLRDAASRFRGDFLEGLALPSCPIFDAWRVAQAEEARQVHAALLTVLSARLDSEPEQALPYAREGVRLTPYSEQARATLVGLLKAAGRHDEAAQHYETGLTMMRQGGAEVSGALESAWSANGKPAAAAPVEEIRVRHRSEDSKAAAERIFDRPAIAVLPFRNLSAGDANDYFGDGLTEDIVRLLALWRWFPVVSSASSLKFRDGQDHAMAIAQELGVRYVVTGSIRRSDDRVRLSVQLSDTSTNGTVWASRFDRRLTDVFDVQDEITEQIVANIVPEISEAGAARAIAKRPQDLGAWELCQRGFWLHRRTTPEDNREARRLFQAAAEKDPTTAIPLAWIAVTYIWDVNLGWSKDPAADIAAAMAAAQRGVQIDRQDAASLSALASCCVTAREAARGLEFAKKAVSFNPSSAWARLALGHAEVFCGEPGQALQAFVAAERLSPRDTLLTFFFSMEALAYLLLRDFDASIEAAERAIDEDPNNIRAWHRLACAAALKGDVDGAHRAAEAANRLLPGLSLAFIDATYQFVDAADRTFLLEGFRKAGWDL